MKEYDIMVVGPVSLDHNIDYLGNERKEVGGAVVASGFAAAGQRRKDRHLLQVQRGGRRCEGALRRSQRRPLLGCVQGHLLHPQPVLHRRQGKAGLHLYGRVRPLPF